MRAAGVVEASKPGKYGTLHRYVVSYACETGDPGMGRFEWACWAYDEEHARNKFFESDEGWRVTGVRRAGGK